MTICRYYLSELAGIFFNRASAILATRASRRPGLIICVIEFFDHFDGVIGDAASVFLTILFN